MRWPELQAPPEFLYGEVESRKYTTPSRMIEIQDFLESTGELLALPEDGIPRLLLDIDVAFEREVDGDILHAEMGQVGVYNRNRARKKLKLNKKGRDWVLKKDQMRKKRAHCTS